MTIIAQATTDGSVGTITAIVTALTGSGFAVWYAWYMTTTQIPRINAEHRETVSSILSEFRAEQRETREVFQHSLAVIERDNERNAMAIDRLCNKLGQPGPLSVKADSVVISKSKSDPNQNVLRDDVG